MVAVSSLFSADTLSGIQWPLGPGDSPPLYFESLEEMHQHRLQKAPGTSSSRATTTDPFGSLNLPETLQNSNENEDSMLLDIHTEKGQFGRIALSLLLLGYGYTDECHNLVTPMSWTDDIHFAAGPSIYSQVSPAIKSFSTYTHSLVHRKEAFHVGEFGLAGFANANFWSNAVKRCESSSKSLPHVEWYQSVVALAQDHEKGYRDCLQVQEWCQQHGFTTTNNNDQDVYFEGRAIHQLCSTALSNSDKSAGNDQQQQQLLKQFAQDVVQQEIQILLHKAMEHAGISLSDDNPNVSTQTPLSSKNPNAQVCNSLLVADEGSAMIAMKTISSAHYNNFASDRSIVLRRAVRNESEEMSQKAVFSAAVKIACRLLSSPACKVSSTSDVIVHENAGRGNSICVVFPLTIEGTIAVERILRRDLAVGDALAYDPDSFSIGSLLETVVNSGNAIIWKLQPCAQDDPQASFVDPLFGTRGETPTTVIQWSKGTIF